MPGFENDGDDYVEIETTILSFTKGEKSAILVETDDGDEVWIPRSCLHGDTDSRVESMGDEPVVIKARKWIAIKKGLY